MLTGTPSIHFWCQKNILDALEWVGRPQNPTCQKITSRGPFKGNVPQQWPGGQNGAKWGPKGGVSTKKHEYRYPKAFNFGPKHILDALEWVGRPSTRLVKVLPPRDSLKAT